MTHSLESTIRVLTEQLNKQEIDAATYAAKVKEATDFFPQTTQGPLKDATSYLAEQAELQRYPWMKSIRESETFWGNSVNLTDAQMKEKFLRMAKAKQLSPTMVMVCLYLLFTTNKEHGRRCLMQLVLFGPADKVVQYHNYYIYQSMQPQEQLLFGEVLEHCPMPLYPPFPEISHLNDEIRAVAIKAKFAGGSESNGDCSAFRKMYGISSIDILEGAGYVEPVYNGQGEQIAAVDMSQTENLLAQLHAGIQNLATAVNHAPQRGRGRGRGRGQSFGQGSGPYRGRGAGGQWAYGGSSYHYEEPKN